MAEGIDYNAEYAAMGDVGELGEFEYFCTAQTDRISYPFPYRCASYMTCDATYGNPHHGATHFDNFGAAFLLIFQVYLLGTGTVPPLSFHVLPLCLPGVGGDMCCRCKP